MKAAFILSIACVVAVLAITGLAQQISNADNAPASSHISHGNDAPAPRSSQAAPPTADQHKIGRFDISINWRTRTEGWEWFQGNTGNSEYALLRVGVGQTRGKLDWFIEGVQASILGLPNDAVVPAPQGQLGLGGTSLLPQCSAHSMAASSRGIRAQTISRFSAPARRKAYFK